MIKSVIFECNGNSIDLRNDQNVHITDIQGVSPISVINTTSISGYDGSTYISSQMPMRNIVITLSFEEGDMEIVKYQLYNIFLVKAAGMLYYQTNSKNLKIECIIEKVEIPPNVYPLKAQISLLCPSPYFTDIKSKSSVMSAVKPLFTFPFTFNGPFMFGERMKSVIENFVNESVINIYPIIEFKAISALSNPSIMNINTYEKMKVNVSLEAGDIIIIDTRLGKKSITEISGSYAINKFNAMDIDFTFFKLYVGDNYLKYDADVNPAGLQTTVTWENLYGGV